MIYKVSKNFKAILKKAVNGLTLSCALFLVLAVAFYSPESHSQSPLSSCNLPLTVDDHPGINCAVPFCSSPILADEYPGINCALLTVFQSQTPASPLPTCDSPLAADDYPGINCALPYCNLPLTADEYPGINCTFSYCSSPLAAGEYPGFNCTLPLPYCSKPLQVVDSPNVNCTLPYCSLPLSVGDNPAINCTLPLPYCSLPPAAGDSAGINCILPSCSSPLAAGETSGVNCTLPYCSSPFAVGDNPGTNCILPSPYCSSPLAAGENPGINCTLPYCSSPPVVGDNPGINCVSNTCSSPLAAGDEPGMNCTLPSCDSLISPNAAEPGKNCLYLNLPICTSNSYATTPLTVTPDHRVNCADPIDLPLCSDISGSQNELKNCIKECRDIAIPADITKIRGVTYAVHNKDCVRFDGNIYSDGTLNDDGNPSNGIADEILTSSEYANLPPEQKSVAIRCHQFVGGYMGPGTCELLSCKLLTLDELNESKFIDNPTKQYCDGSDKCYSFPQEKLPALLAREENTMCTIHNCQPQPQPASDFLPNCANDFNTIIDLGDSYTQDYIDFIVGGNPANLDPTNDNADVKLELQKYCTPLTTCLPLIQRQYYCTAPNNGDGKPTTLNVRCDPTSSCIWADADTNRAHSNGFCERTIDCNKEPGERECILPTEETPDPTDIPDESWFYNPKPMSKSIKNGSLRTMNAGLCYSKGQMKNENNWGRNLWIRTPAVNIGFTTIPAINIDLGYFHFVFGDSTRSPGMCGARKDGIRGGGYPYLCGNDGSMYTMINDYTAYHRENVETTFSDYASTSKLKVCLRFKNVLRPMGAMPNSETCGKRECAISCLGKLDPYCSQACGEDVCRTLTVEDSLLTAATSKDCIMRANMFNTASGFGNVYDASNAATGSLVEGIGEGVIDDITDDIDATSNIGESIAGTGSGTIDGTGTSAAAGAIENPDANLIPSYESIFHNGVSKPCLATVDRFLRIRAVQYGNRICTFLDAKGNLAYNPIYMDGTETLDDGTCLAEENAAGECKGKDSNDVEGSAQKWRALRRIPYIQNNRAAGEPQGYLKLDGQLVREQECIQVPLRTRTPKLYQVANRNNTSKLFKPPLYILNTYTEIGGSVSVPTQANELLGSTDFNYPEIKIKYGALSQKLSLTLGKTGYELEEINKDPNASASLSTIFNGVNYSTDIFIRKEFNQATSTPLLCLYETVTNALNISQDTRLGCVNRKYPQINNVIDGATSIRKAIIAAPISPINTYDNARITLKFQGKSASDISNMITLGSTIQSTPQCSKDTENYKICAQREECTQLTNECVKAEIDIQNAAFDADISQFLATRDYCNNILTPICDQKQGTLPDGTLLTNSYGWFNEICISSGFEKDLRNVIAHKVLNGSSVVPLMIGKCLINNALSGGQACLDGGNASQDCHCIEFSDGMTLNPNEIVRKQTPREAGLCLDVQVPQTCPEIKYLTAAARTAGTNSGNADFVITPLGGMNKVAGQCLGNWRSLGSSIPMMNCSQNADGTASWNYPSMINACVRYSCNQIVTAPSINPISHAITYSGNYTSENTDALQGREEGYAEWPSQTSSDSLQNVTGSCITGFEDDGTLPSRNCNRTGGWENISNSCVRITCPAQNFVSNNPLVSGDDVASAAWIADWGNSAINPENLVEDTPSWDQVWSNWDNAGGASFSQKPASRIAITASQPYANPASIATGTCNEKLGYFQSGITPPTMTCDSTGQWLPVKNRCVTTCKAVDATTSYSATNGNAYWNQANAAEDGTFVRCIPAEAGDEDYKAYPYAPYHDKNGVEINQTTETYNGTTYKIYSDNTGTSNPQRVCVSSDTDGISSSHWGAVYPSCINKCPGSTTDDRVGVGITKHKLSDLSYVYLHWNDTDPGQHQILSSSDILQQNISNYGPTHSGTFAVKRVCGADYKWQTYSVDGNIETVIPQCSGRSASITGTNATFTSDPATDTINELGTVQGTCDAANNYAYRSAEPEYECKQKTNTRYIDQFYYAKTATSGTCEKTCALPAATTDDVEYEVDSGAYYNGYASGSQFEGAILNLSCIDGYGQKVGGSTSSTADSNSGCNLDDTIAIKTTNNNDGSTTSHSGSVTPKTDRNGGTPTITCSSGSWGSVVNKCSACRDCTSDSVTKGYTKDGVFGNSPTCYARHRRKSKCTKSKTYSPILTSATDGNTSKSSNNDRCTSGKVKVYICYAAEAICRDGTYYMEKMKCGADSGDQCK